MKTSKVAEAYTRCEPARKAIAEAHCRCMEVTEDKCGILWERWITPHGKSMILFATPHYWDVFAPLSDDATIAGMIDAIRAVCGPNQRAAA